MNEYAVRVIRGGGSADGDVIEIFPDLTEARAYIDNPPSVWADAVLAIYDLTPCWEE